MSDHPKRLGTFREVTWNLAPAYLETDESGLIQKGRGYNGLIESLGYDIDDFDDVYSLLKSLGADNDSINSVHDAIKEISSGEDYTHMTNKEFDFDLNGYHYHLTAFRKKDGFIGFHFGDQTETTLRKRQNEEKISTARELFHRAKNLFSGYGLIILAMKKLEKYSHNPEVAKSIEYLKTITESIGSVSYALDAMHGILVSEESDRPFNPRYVKLFEEIVEPTYEIFSPKAVARKITFDRRLRKEDPDIFADKEKMQEVFYELFSNAMKYGEDGMTISCGYRVIKEEGNPIGKTIIFWNTKSYVEPENIDKIFEEYWTTKGTGLGLAQVKKIIEEEHKGNVRAESGFDESIKDTYMKIEMDLYDDSYLLEKGLLNKKLYYPIITSTPKI